jgi:hypothetical protein
MSAIPGPKSVRCERNVLTGLQNTSICLEERPLQLIRVTLHDLAISKANGFLFCFLSSDSYWFFDLYLPFDFYLLFFAFCTLLMQFVNLDNIRLVSPHGIPFGRTTLCLNSFISIVRPDDDLRKGSKHVVTFVLLIF